MSTRLLHVGFAVFDRKAADAFYRGVLGFRVYWQGGLRETDTNWVQLQVPDGSDWIEYTLNADTESGFGQLSVSNPVSRILGHKAIAGTIAVSGIYDRFDRLPEIRAALVACRASGCLLRPRALGSSIGAARGHLDALQYLKPTDAAFLVATAP